MDFHNRVLKLINSANKYFKTVNVLDDGQVISLKNRIILPNK